MVHQLPKFNNTTEKKSQDIIEQKYVIMITDTIESACELNKL